MSGNFRSYLKELADNNKAERDRSYARRLAKKKEEQQTSQVEPKEKPLPKLPTFTDHLRLIENEMHKNDEKKKAERSAAFTELMEENDSLKGQVNRLQDQINHLIELAQEQGEEIKRLNAEPENKQATSIQTKPQLVEKNLRDLIELYPEITLRQVLVLMSVARQKECLLTQVVEDTNIPQSVCSRTLRVCMTDTANSKNLGLIEVRQHTTDGRKKLLSLTPLGYKLLMCQ